MNVREFYSKNHAHLQYCHNHMIDTNKIKNLNFLHFEFLFSSFNLFKYQNIRPIKVPGNAFHIWCQ
jgi:hypothetical protein